MGSIMMFPILLLLIGVAFSENPYEEFRSNFELYNTNIGNPAYRLLDTVQPRYLDVDLDVYLSESRFNGLVQIEVEVKEANFTQIVLHQNVVAITTVTVQDSNGNIIPLQWPDPFETDSYFELLKINLNSPIPAGTYTLGISYRGQINENPLNRGFYKGYYYDINNEKHEYATTQFQPFHARKAFPCFDEPQFKSTYVISITRDSYLSPSYSNMAINVTQTVGSNRIRETFLPTPIISAYLVAFHVSDFVETTATSTAAKPFGIVSRHGAESQHPYAAEMGVKITSELDEYLDFGYYTMGQGNPMKNDHIALPDFPSGAMENWGMVNYREAYLLYDEHNTNLQSQIFISTIIAHEMAHKWFGNLVTCFWWSNLWLNESFASFFEYFSAHGADPSLELADQFVVDAVHSALTSDAGSGATPMNWTGVVNNPSVSAHFSTTSYAKGASVLRMMEHFVGPTVFRNALRLYLKDNAYGLGEPRDMYAAFRTAVSSDPTFAQLYPNINVEEVFDSWVQNSGAPVLNVDVNMSTGEITLTQNRFQLTGTIPNTIWQIPVSWTHGGSPNFESTKPALVMTTRTATVTKDPGHHWVLFNIAQSGLYRVNYDDHSWEMLAAALRNNRETFPKLNRAQIVNDVLFFIRAESDYISIERAFDVLSFLKDETDYYVWSGALTQLDWIRRRLEHVPAAYQEFHDYLLEQMDNVIEHLGYEERSTDSTSTILNRMQIMNYACNVLQHEGCVNYSKERWQQFRQNSSEIVHKNARRYVYCVGLREGNYSDYEFLFQRYNASENTADMVVILRTLACTKDEAALNHYLQQSLYSDKIRIHDKTNAFSFALQGNKENFPVVLNFLKATYADIANWYGGVDRLNIAMNALSAYMTDFEVITDFQTWLYSNQVNLSGSFSTGNAVINTSINNLRWGNNVAVDLFSTLRNRNSAGTITLSAVIIVAAALAHLFK